MSGLNILFSSTLKKMVLDITDMLPSMKSPFYGIVPRRYPLVRWFCQLPSGHVPPTEPSTPCVEVADFETSYHAILVRPALAKFMAIPHYVYLVLKMPGPNSLLSL